MRRALGATMAVAGLLGIARADVAPLGPEFRASEPTQGYRLNPGVAADAGGRFVVVWDEADYYGSPAGDGDDNGVVARRYDATGTPAGPPFVVNTYTTGAQYLPSVSSDAAGNFVVAWTSGTYYADGQDGSASGVFLQRFDAAGARFGGEELVPSYTIGPQDSPDVASEPTGDFVVVWTSGGYGSEPDGDDAGIFGQRFDAGGGRLGTEFQVNSFTTGWQTRPAVAMLGSGGFVVAWESSGYPISHDGDGAGIFAQRFAPSGAPAGIEFQVNTYTTGGQYHADVAPLPGGGFVVAWEHADYYSTPDGSGASIAARRFDAGGAPLGPEFQVNTFTTGYQNRPAVAADADGNFVVAWQSGGYGSSPDGSGRAIRAQHFASDGTALGAEVQVNTYTPGSQRTPAVAADGLGGFVIAWRGYKDGSAGVFGQRLLTSGFTAPIPLAGTRLVLKDGATPARRKLTLVARDPAVSDGAGDGSIDDPTITGGSVRVHGTSFDHTYALPAANWRSLGSGLGYEYRDPRALDGPITRVRIRTGRSIDIRGQGAGLVFTLASNPRPVRVALQTGTVGQRSCLTFDGGYAFKPGTLFRATNAAAPASCPT